MAEEGQHADEASALRLSRLTAAAATTLGAALAAMVLAFAPAGLGAAEYSSLWGEAGERWSPRSRLPDFSFAGYQRGEKALPTVPHGVSVRDFGARGDGEADDTAAFLAALERTNEGAIEVPPGRYRITRPLEITRPNVVLRGAGPDQTVLLFPIPLNLIKPRWTTNTEGGRTSGYSWSGGFVSIRGSFRSNSLAAITADAERGDDSVVVDSTVALRPGRRVEVFQSDTSDNSLAEHLYSGDSGSLRNLKGRTAASLIGRVTRLEGRRVHLDRTLRCDVRRRWRPQLCAFEPDVTGSGVENLRFEFPGPPYEGHFKEKGFNAIALEGVADCWVRNIRIVNADSGLFITGAFNTVRGVVLESTRLPDREGCVGHHGISVTGNDNWITGFDLRTRYLHDIGVSRHCSGNVFSDGRGVDLALDHHRFAPYENLFTDLDAGAGRRLWKSGGGAQLGKHCGARGTFWNIRADHWLRYPPSDFGPSTLNVVGLHSAQVSITRADGKWFESIPPARLQPENLHEAQLKRRLARSREIP